MNDKTGNASQAGCPGSMENYAKAVLRRIRVRKQDSAFVYALLEAYEGITAYSTLPTPGQNVYCDLELQVPIMFIQDVNELLVRLSETVVDLGEVNNPGI